MQKYLNRRNKSLVIQLGYVQELADNAIRSMKLEGDLKRRLRTAATNSRKVFEGIVGGLNQDERKALMRTLQHTELTLQSKSEIALNEKEFEESQDLFCEIYDAAQDRCRACSEGEAVVRDCLLRKAFIAYKLPVYDDENEDWECPYKDRRYRK